MSTDEVQTGAIDLTRAPRGEMAAAQLVAAVADTGDLAERHYLELKGPLDLASKVNKTKVAKFILAAANRLPDRAAEAFEGYGVMIVGITKNGIEGVAPIEMLALSQVVQPFLGAAGPRWDIVRVPVADSANQVMVFLVDPPSMGQAPFICRANGDGLRSGRIYFRGDGDTREATADELDLLMARGVSAPRAPVRLDVAVVGSVVQVIVDKKTRDEVVAKVRRRLLAALPKPEPEYESLDATIGAFASLSSMFADRAFDTSPLAAYAAAEEPEKRTEEEYRAEIDAWEKQFRGAWADAVDMFVVHVLPANEIAVVNETRTFLHDVEVKLHLAGDVEVAERQGYKDVPEWGDLQLPPPPRKWGPTKRNFGLDAKYSVGLATPAVAQAYVPRQSSWKTTGSVEIDVAVGDLRPEATFQTNDGAAVLVVRGERAEPIQGTWTATARGYNEVFSGAVEVTIAEPTLLRDLVRNLFNLD